MQNSFYYIIWSILLFLSVLPLQAQPLNWARPMKIPLQLSGDFGQLRGSHFHGGVDFRTQGRENIPVYAAERGYVSRIYVSPFGFGRAVYITHPGGWMTVYGHVNRFAPKIEKRVQALQRSRESFALDQYFKPGEIPIEQGELIALSGNKGSSGGPHLHMDLRNPQGEQTDFMRFFRDDTPDHTAPTIAAVMLCRLTDWGADTEPWASTTLRVPKESVGRLGRSFRAWGKVGFALQANDRMDGLHFSYGVHRIELYEGDRSIYHCEFNRVNLGERRAINGFIDYRTVQRGGGRFMRSWMATQLRMPDVQATQRGVVEIDERRTYSFRYVITDDHGNRTELTFQVEGDPAQAYTSKPVVGKMLASSVEHKLEYADARLTIPACALFTDIDFLYCRTPSTRWLSDLHVFHTSETPMRLECQLGLRVAKEVGTDPRKYYIVQTDSSGKALRPIVGKYTSGWITAKIYQFGTYAVAIDTIAPTIRPRNQDNWKSQQQISFTITDRQTGVRTFRGTIDGRFVIFEFDAKTARLFCNLKDETLAPSTRPRRVSIIVTDECGNQAQWNASVSL